MPFDADLPGGSSAEIPPEVEAAIGELNLLYRSLVRFPSPLERRLYKNTPKAWRRAVLRRRQRADLAYLRNSDGFDEEWYVRTYGQVEGVRSDPMLHFIEQGERQGFQPNAYLRTNTSDLEKYEKSLFSGSYYVAYLKARQKLWGRRCLGRGTVRSPALTVPFAAATGYRLPSSIAVICHCYYLDLLGETLAGLENIPAPYDLYLSTDTPEKRDRILQALKSRPSVRAEVRLCENRGRDIAPKFVTFRDVYSRHEWFLHLHTKKSLHDPEMGARWRRYLYASLLGSREIVRSIFQVLEQPGIGVVYPCHFDRLELSRRWGDNFAIAAPLLSRMGIEADPLAALDFPAGSMFWARSAALRPLLDLKLTFRDFPEEGHHVDGTLAHAIERCICLVAGKAGFRGQPIVLRNHRIAGERPVVCAEAAHLPAALAQSQVIARRIRTDDQKLR